MTTDETEQLAKDNGSLDLSQLPMGGASQFLIAWDVAWRGLDPDGVT